MSITRLIKDKDKNAYAKVDAAISALRMIDAAHAEVHEGEAFMVSGSAAAAAEATYEVRFQTPNSMKECHMMFKASSSLEMRVQIFETTTKTHVGNNALTPLNRNRNSNETSTATVCHTPGDTGDGDVMFDETVGTTGKSGGITRSDAEFILKRNTAYLVKLTSNKASNTLNAELDWYEERTATYTTTTTSTTTTTTTTSTA